MAFNNGGEYNDWMGPPQDGLQRGRPDHPFFVTLFQLLNPMWAEQFLMRTAHSPATIQWEFIPGVTRGVSNCFQYCEVLGILARLIRGGTVELTAEQWEDLERQCVRVLDRRVEEHERYGANPHDIHAKIIDLWRGLLQAIRSRM